MKKKLLLAVIVAGAGFSTIKPMEEAFKERYKAKDYSGYSMG